MKLRMVTGLVEVFFDYKKALILFKGEIPLVVAVEILSAITGGIGAREIGEVESFGSQCFPTDFALSVGIEMKKYPSVLF